MLALQHLITFVLASLALVTSAAVLPIPNGMIEAKHDVNKRALDGKRQEGRGLVDESGEGGLLGDDGLLGGLLGGDLLDGVLGGGAGKRQLSSRTTAASEEGQNLA